MDLVTYLLSKKYTDKVISEGINVSPLIKTDNTSIEHFNDILSLAGFSTAEVLTSPVKQADGTLKWMIQDTTQIQSIIGNIPSTSNAETLVDYIQEESAKSVKTLTIGDAVISALNGNITIPIATANEYGLVKGSDEIQVSEDGNMSISSVDVNKLTQTEGQDLILDCSFVNKTK